MWHLWQDHIQGIGGEGGSVGIWLFKLKAFGGFARGLGRCGCNWVRGDMELAGEVGPESMRRLEAASGANEGLNLPICKDA